MKRFLLVLMCCLSFTGLFSQNISLRGPSVVTKGQSYTYEIVYGAPVSVPKYGSIKVNKGTSKPSVFAIPVGLAFFSFKVTFTEVTNSASVIVADGSGEAFIKGIIVKEGSTTSPNSNITGPDILYWSEKGRYALTNFGGFSVDWSSYPEGLSFSYEMTNKGENRWDVAYIQLSESMLSKKVERLYLRASYEYSRDKTWYKEESSKFIKILYPEIVIDNDMVCGNSLVVCQLKNIRNGDVINWQSTPTMTLVSGQGTTKATYRAINSTTGKKGIVKANITNGKTYTVENSNVWVGSPATPQINGLSSGDYKPNTDYPIFAVDNQAENVQSFNWRIIGGAKLVKGVQPNLGPNSSMTLRTDNLLPNRSTSFSIYLTSQNKCGTSPELVVNGTVVAGGGLNPGGTDPEPMLKSFSDQKAVSPVSVKVYNFSTGTLVHQEKNTTNFNIQNTSLNDGFYVVVTTNEKGEITSEKVMKSSK